MRSGTFLKKTMVILAGTFVSFPSVAQSQALNVTDGVSPIGHWQSDKRGGFQVAIEPCADALCGTIVRDLSPASSESDVGDPENKPKIGWQILRNFNRNQEGEWIGEMHDYRNGKQYDCVMVLISPNELMVRPFIGIRLIGKKHLWFRVAEPENRVRPYAGHL